MFKVMLFSCWQDFTHALPSASEALRLHLLKRGCGVSDSSTIIMIVITCNSLIHLKRVVTWSRVNQNQSKSCIVKLVLLVLLTLPPTHWCGVIWLLTGSFASESLIVKYRLIRRCLFSEFTGNSKGWQSECSITHLFPQAFILFEVIYSTIIVVFSSANLTLKYIQTDLTTYTKYPHHKSLTWTG